MTIQLHIDSVSPPLPRAPSPDLAGHREQAAVMLGVDVHWGCVVECRPPATDCEFSCSSPRKNLCCIAVQANPHMMWRNNL